MIRGYLLPSGKLAWEIPIHPKDKNFIGGTPWGGISLDSKKNLLFVFHRKSKTSSIWR